jgi:predicted MFS family arabinose efflux permease
MTISASDTAGSSKPSSSAPGAFSPMRHRVFAVIWVATVLGNVGTFIHNVASSWIVAEMSNSPAAVALVQTATALPAFLLAIPAGVLSDIVDRRKLLISMQVALAIVSGMLMVLAMTGGLTVPIVIALTFAGGVCTAIATPTWQAIVPEMVPKADLRNAITLNSMGLNIARSVGPAIGGLLLVSVGAAVTYGVDVASYFIVIAALIWWRRPPNGHDDLSEHFGGALRAGLRYARASRELQIVMLRTALFFGCASLVWALLPVIARDLLGGGATFYGVLLGAVGSGAIVGAVVLPWFRSRYEPDVVLLGATLITAAVLAILTLRPPQWAAFFLLVLLGTGWIAALTTLNGTVQSVLPNWVRGRALAIYLTVVNGSIGVGSIAWGGLAEGIGISATVLIGAAGLASIAIVASQFKLPSGEADLAPSNHWPEPLVAEPIEQDRGPVLITIEYHIEKDDRPNFLKALGELSLERRRDGAFVWGVSEDAAVPERIMEWFMVESWAEHMRQHHRVSKADAKLEQQVREFHKGAEEPRIQHFLTLDPKRDAVPGNGNHHNHDHNHDHAATVS